MVDLRRKLYMRGLEGIFGWKADYYLEDAALKGTARRPKDGALPVEEIVVYRTGATASGGILL